MTKKMKRRSQRSGARRAANRRVVYRDEAGRRSSALRGYDRDWRALRERWLRKHPECVNAGKVVGCGIGATEVDHIKPIERGGSRLRKSNLQSMCHTCHNRKTARETVGSGPMLFDNHGMPLNVDHHWRTEG